MRTYDATHGRLEHTYALYGGARDNRFSYDTLALGPNDELATGVYTGIAQLWSTKTGHELATPHLVAAAPVASLAVDPTAPLLASVGGSDGTVKLSNLPALDSFGAAFPLEAGQWGTAAFTPDGSHLIVLFSDGRGDIWPTTRAAWLRHACAVAGRNLTREEWGRYLGTTPYEKTCPGPR